MGQGQSGPLRDGVDTVKNQSITSLPRSPQDDRRARMIKYSLAMGIRMICLLSLLFVQGWWLFVMAAGAILLPYVAVVLANVGTAPGVGAETPSGREVAVRNPQTPIIIPAADEPSFPRSDGEQFPQQGEYRFPQQGEYRFPQQGDGQPFAQQPFAQTAGQQDAPSAPSFPQQTERPADGRREGQA